MAGGVDTAEVLAAYRQMPLAFEANQGQTDAAVRFLARVGHFTLFLTPAEAVLRVGEAGDVLRMRMVGGKPNPEMVGLEPLGRSVSYYSGDDPARRLVGVRSYAKVAYRGVYPGIDAVYYGNHGRLEYDFVVAPGVDPGVIAVSFEGAKGLRIDRRGDLIVRLAGGEIIQRRPHVYQEGPAGRETLPGRYVLRAGTIGFELGAYDRSRPLIIDPLVYSTYLGGNQYDYAFGIDVDGEGNAVVTGNTQSTNFPTKNSVDGDDGENLDDAFVTKFNATGSGLIYSTYLSGSGNDEGYDVAVDGAGSAYVTGKASSGFPTTSNRLQPCDNFADAFVTKLSASGGLVYSSCLGGTARDMGMGIALDTGRNAVVVGMTASTNFPTAAPLQATYGGGEQDGFVAKLNSTGSGLLYSTYLGGADYDRALGVAVDSSGATYVAGWTSSTNFPLVAPLQSSFGGDQDLFVAKLVPDGSALAYSSYLGGSGREGGTAPRAMGLAVDGGGRAYLAARTTSTDFPKAGTPFQAAHAGGGGDIVVAKVNGSGSGLVYSTYLGGSGDEDPYLFGTGLALDGSGAAYVTSTTGSDNFPTANAIRSSRLGQEDAFVTKLNPAGSGLVYSTYLGGTRSEIGLGIAVDPDGNAYAAGLTASPDFPTAGSPYQPLLNEELGNLLAAGDAYITKFDPWLGFLRVTTNPALPSQITVDGVPRTTWGTTNLEAAPGSHQVCFRDVEGFTKPACQDVTVSNGAVTEVAGDFTQRGFLQVVTNPALPAKITVGDHARDDWGIYTDLPTGTYRVCFGPVKDYAPPPCQNATVSAGTTTTVTGSYTLSLGAPGEPAGNGALRVTTNPALPSQITVDGVPRATWGLINLQIAPGSHTVCFRDVEGFVTPACQTVDVVAGQTTVVEGNFVAKGFLQVVTSPALPAAIYVNNVPRDDWGIYTDYPVGAYEVCFGAVWGYRTPPCQTVNVTAGATTAVTGTFTAS